MPTPFRGRWLLLAFGFALSFFSNFGQTPFVAVFGGEIRAAFGLSNGGWGAIYSIATLTSGILITKVGGWIDAIALRRYAIATVIGLSAAAAVAAIAPNVVALALAIFLLRFFGQGLMTHIAVTAMAREFVAARGRAVAIASMGLPAGAAIFPAFGALMAVWLGWRGAWAAFALICLVIVLPLAPLLLRRHGSVPPPPPAPFAVLRFLGHKDMLLALPALTATGFVTTAIAFHQVVIATSKGWSPALVASSFAALGVTSIVATLASGWLVDRVGPRRPALLFQWPMALGCLVLALSDAPAAIFIYMTLQGVSAGAYGPVTTSLLAEAYGVERLGAIRASAAAVMVVSTALSPVLFGLLVDWGVTVDALVTALALFTMIAIAMLYRSNIVRRPGQSAAAKA